MDSILSFVASLGLGTPLNRAVAFGALGFGLQFFIKPSVSYSNVGGKSVPKQLALFSGGSSGAPTTYLPWYLWPVLFALFGAVFL
jgi:hypothetical protein